MATSIRSVRLPRTLSFTIIAVLLFLGIVLVFAAVATAHNEGHFIYALDDTYIHMAIAKNFVLHNVWASSGNQFVSSTSSPLWTLLLAICYKIAGVNDYVPLILNVLAGIGVLVASSRLLSQENAPAWFNRGVLILVVLLMPLPVMALVGMEHVLHTLLAIGFVYFSARLVSTEIHELPGRTLRLTILLTALLSLVRYESIFMVLPVVLLLLARRRWLHAVLVALAEGLPIVVYGLISVANGALFLPNSVLIKGNRPPFGSIREIPGWIYRSVVFFIDQPPWLFIFVIVVPILMYAALRHRNQPFCSDYRVVAALVFLSALVLHVFFAALAAPLYRYDAYLMVLGILVVCLLIIPYLTPRFIDLRKAQAVGLPMVTTASLLIVWGIRAGYPLEMTIRGMEAIYRQQYQMAQFVKQYYDGQTIAINDIGLISYTADVQVFDIAGLASDDVARALVARQPTLISGLAAAKGVTVALIYKAWMPSRAAWTEVGEWGVEDQAVLGSRFVTFYAVDPSQKESLVKHMKEFRPKLPYYTVVWYPLEPDGSRQD